MIIPLKTIIQIKRHADVPLAFAVVRMLLKLQHRAGVQHPLQLMRWP